MAQTSAQRDPSMEEILASIRKIIEEGEEARQKPADLRDDFDVTPIGPAANDATRRPLAPAPELRMAIPQVEPAQPIMPEPVRKPEIVEMKDLDEAVAAAEAAINELSLSLDDFAIDIDEVDDEALEEPSPQEPVQAIVQDVPESIQKNEAAKDVLEQKQDLPRPNDIKTALASDVSTAAAEEAPVSVAKVAETVVPETRIFVAPQAQAPRAVVNTMVAGPAKVNRPVVTSVSGAVGVQMDAKGAMLSQAVERQVAASFTELSEALAASRRRPLDQIAEEMMRPMLQEWLDNNLPTLVERLVREEIERVARGAS